MPSRPVAMILLGSASLMVALAGAFWFGLIPMAAGARGTVAVVLLVAAAADVAIAVWFLGKAE